MGEEKYPDIIELKLKLHFSAKDSLNSTKYGKYFRDLSRGAGAHLGRKECRRIVALRCIDR